MLVNRAVLPFANLQFAFDSPREGLHGLCVKWFETNDFGQGDEPRTRFAPMKDGMGVVTAHPYQLCPSITKPGR